MARAIDQRRDLVVATTWIERLLWMIACLALIAISSRSVVGADGATVWRTDFNSALAEAEQRKLPLLVHFSADWCMPCQRMEREVLSTSVVRDVLNSKFVATKVNSDHHHDLVKRYGVETLPSDLVIDSLTGRTLSLHSGYIDRIAYLQMANQAEAKFRKIHPNSFGSEGENSVVAVPSAADLSNAVRESELGEPQPIIGLNGFSPVAIAKHRKWVRGSARFAWDYKDITYYMSSREELLEFRNDPDSIAPKLLGCDPVILWESDRAVAGDIEFGAFFDGELYLFKTEERRQQFKANPEKFIRLQHALKIDQIERTALR